MTSAACRSFAWGFVLGWFVCGVGCIRARSPATGSSGLTDGASTQESASASVADVAAAGTEKGTDTGADSDLAISFSPDFLHDVGWTRLDRPLPLELIGGAGPVVRAQREGSNELLHRLTLERLGVELARARLDDTSLILDEWALCSSALSAAVAHARPRRLLLSIQGGLTPRAVQCLAGLRAERLYVTGCLPQGSDRESCRGDAELEALAASDGLRSRIVGLAVYVAAAKSLERLERFPRLRLLALATRSREVALDLPFAILPRLHHLDLLGWQGDLPDSGMLLSLFRSLRTLRWPTWLRGPLPQPCRLERISGLLTEDVARALSSCERLRELSNDQVAFGFTSAEPIAALRHLERLHLRHFQSTQLAALAALTELRRLSLPGSGAADFAFVSRLPHLESLDLSHAKLVSLDVLANVKGLQTLDVGFTSVSELTPLASLTGLTKLHLHETKVTELGPLAALRRLQELSISGTPASDLSPLANHPALEWVILYESRVTDVSTLLTLPRLRRANIGRLPVSAAQKQQLIQRIGRSNVDDF